MENKREDTFSLFFFFFFFPPLPTSSLGMMKGVGGRHFLFSFLFLFSTPLPPSSLGITKGVEWRIEVGRVGKDKKK